MNSYRKECLIAKRVREGVISQREKVCSRKKRAVKNWTVYWSIFGSRRNVNDFMECKFALEEDALRYASKVHRRFSTFRLKGINEEHVWVVNDGLIKVAK